MSNERKKKETERVVPGPKPERLKIEGDWREAIKKSLAKKKPVNNWPKQGRNRM
jgi:hypothetical protein